MDKQPKFGVDDWPRHDELPWTTRLVEGAAISFAILLLIWQSGRLLSRTDVWDWRLPTLILAAVFAADFISGMVHWFADTWFDESVPLLGRRFVRPFRVHHVNPGDFLRRDFVDTNGDVAMLAIPMLVSVFWLPLDLDWGKFAAVFVVALCAAALPTNQVHQWAHRPQPPWVVSRLQHLGLLLRPRAHELHHAPPHVTNYCIANGWCNPLLSALNFFRRLEWLVTRLTGWQPRRDDAACREQTSVARKAVARKARP